MSENNKSSLAVVILAAGKGSRMQSDKPKVMHELAGQPMIKWLLRSVESLKADRVVVVVGPDMPELEQVVQPCKTIVQQERNGTGGALECALELFADFKGEILVLLGDTPLLSSQSMQDLIDKKRQSATTGCAVLGMHLDHPFGYGRLIEKEAGILAHIVEEKDASEKERAVQLVNTGAFCLDGRRVQGWLAQVDDNNAAGEKYITDLPHIAARDGFETAIALVADPQEAMGCNTKLDLARLNARLQDQMRSAFLMSGVHIMDPTSLYLHYDTVIEPGAIIEPHVFCGPGVYIGANAHVKAFCHFEGCRIGQNVTIGPYARLRPGSTLEDDVRIGNFVEIKKSTIGARSKIPHLSYVGDCTMGEDVNFSAGAITVNYDGFEKHQTHIGKGVIVGSNANLIAPITIDDGAFIAAGSTVTEDVPENALSITRESGKIREGWAAEYRKKKAAVLQKLGKS